MHGWLVAVRASPDPIAGAYTTECGHYAVLEASPQYAIAQRLRTMSCASRLVDNANQWQEAGYIRGAHHFPVRARWPSLEVHQGQCMYCRPIMTANFVKGWSSVIIVEATYPPAFSAHARTGRQGRGDGMVTGGPGPGGQGRQGRGRDK